MVRKLRRIASALRQAVLVAGQAALAARKRGLKVKRKSAIDLTTSADLCSEQAFIRSFGRQFPAIPVFGEESVTDRQLAQAVPKFGVILDSLDGTLNFLRRQPYWGVMAAYFEHGTPVASAICLPEGDQLMVAHADGGVFLGRANEYARLRPVVLAAKRLSTTAQRLFLCAEVHRFTTAPQLENGLLRFVRRGCVVGNVSNGTAADGMLSLLRGQVDVYLNCGGGKIWDFAAGACAIEIAGGLALDCKGRKLNYRSWEMNVALCANRAVGQTAKAILRNPTERQDA